jgi:hypothetical protein
MKQSEPISIGMPMERERREINTEGGGSSVVIDVE